MTETMNAPVDAILTWERPRDVAHTLDYTVAHIYHLIHRRQLHAVQTRLGWLVDPASVEAYRASGARGKRRIKACA